MASTGKAVRAEAVQALSPLREQFDQWRAVRRNGEKIPAQLWDAAVSATAEHGAYRVSHELRLDYMMLKRRAAGAGVSASASASVPAPRFMELAVRREVAMSAPQPEPPCVVEMANARGATMHLQLHGAALACLPALCQGFWSA